MANQNFVVQNGLTVGPLTIDAATGSISTTGTVSITGGLAVSSISQNDSSVSITDTGTGSNVRIIIDGVTEHTVDGNGLNLASGDAYSIGGASVLTSTTLGSGVVSSSLTSVGTLTGLVSSGQVNITNTTQSGSSATGALLVSGGVGIGANLNVAGNLVVGGNINFTGQVNAVTFNTTSGQFNGNAGGAGALYAGITSGYAALTDTVLQLSTNLNSFAQVNSQNINAGSLASTDFVATANNGTQLDTYIDMGIASSTYSYPGFTIIKPNDGYLLAYGNTTTGGGNLVLTSGLNDIVFAAGGSNTNNEFGRITAANVFAIKSTVSSTNSSSGALTVAGGVGIAGSINVGGNMVITGCLTVNGTTTTINNTTVETTEFVQTIDATTIRASTLGNVGATLTGTLSTASQPNITTLGGVTSVGTLTGLTVSGAIAPSTNNTINLGNASNYWATIYGTSFVGVSTTAKYADLAENYLGDKFYPTGSVLMFGGAEEVTVASADTTRVAGVVSSNPAHLMNGGLTGPNVIAVALTGRVPCNVIGPVQKGDLMVSAGFGYAKVNNTPAVGTIIGKALQDFPMATKGMIEVVVGRF